MVLTLPRKKPNQRRNVGRIRKMFGFTPRFFKIYAFNTIIQ